MIRRSIVAGSVAVVVALLVVGAAVDVLVSRHLHRSLDASLRTRAVGIAQLSATAPSLVTQPGALDAPSGGQQASVEVIDRHGRIVARSLALGGRVLPVAEAARAVTATGRSRYLHARIGSDTMRVFIAPLADAGGSSAGGAVAVAASTRDLEETLSSIQLIIVVATLVAAATAALLLTLLMRRALAPLGRLERAAAEIEQTGDARRRLPQVETDDEIGRLAATLNGMLTALERARDSERRFLADASHELRTPLTALLGNVEYLRRHGASDELVTELETDTRRLSRLADDLLALSREEAAASPAEVVDVAELVRELDDVVVSGAEPARVLGDRAALARALGNLVENARRHGRGRITVATAVRDATVVVSVSDEGPGLRAEETKLAFGRFWRGGSSSGGSGLGLAIVRATAERHGGRAYAEGSRFTIELPALRDVSESRRTTGAS